MFVLLKYLEGKFIKDEKKCNEVVSHYVKNLILESVKNVSTTQDIAMFRLNSIEGSFHQINDIYENIRNIIPGYNPTLLPSLNQKLKDLKLRQTSINIIVSDFSKGVSKNLLYMTMV